MKKVLAILLVVLMVCSVGFAEVDLSGLGYEELLALHGQVTMALWECDEWQEVTVPAGVYEIGVDIPSAKWVIKPIDGTTVSLKWGGGFERWGNGCS